MTSNIRLDSMEVNKQILLDLFLSFGMTKDKVETIEQFVTSSHAQLGLSLAGYLSAEQDKSFLQGTPKKSALNYKQFIKLTSTKKITILAASSIKSVALKNAINKDDEVLIYKGDNHLMVFACDKKRELFQEKTFTKLLDRFDFFITNLTDNNPITSIQNDPIQQSMFNVVLDNLDQEILVLNNDFVIQYFNPGIRCSFFHSFVKNIKVGDELLGGNTKKIELEYKALLDRVLKGDEINFDFNPKNLDNDCKMKYANVTFKPIRDQKNKITGIISITKCITDIVELNHKLEKGESTLKTILDSTPDGIYAVDKNLELITINEQARQDFKEYASIDLQPGDNLHDKISPEKLEPWKEKYFNKVFKNESLVVNLSMENKSKNKTIFVENRYVPIKDKEGNIFAAMEVCRDITDLVDKENTLVAKELELRSLLDNTPTGIAKIGLDGKISYITKRTCNMLGVERSDVLKTSIFRYIHKSEHKKLLRQIKDLIEGENEVNTMFRGIHPTKEVFYISGIASISKDIDGNPIEFLLAFNDISEEVAAQQSFLKSRKRYKSILDGSYAGLAQVNKDGQFIFVSKRAARILGSDPDTIKTKGFLDYIDKQHRETVTENLKTMTEPDQLIEFRVKGQSDKGNVFYLDGTATLLEDDEIGMSTLFNFNDVTSRVLAEKELAVYNAEVQEKSAIYKALIDNSFDGIEIIELTSTNAAEVYGAEIVIRNDKMHEYFGKSSKPFIAIEDILKISPEVQANGKPTKDIFQKVVQDNLDGNTSINDWRFYINDKLEDFQFSSNVIQLEDKTLLIRNLRKVTGMKNQQATIKNQLDALSLKNEELETYIQSNLQLENFAYIASHDLKAPLRTVSSFAFLLKQKAYANLDEKSKGYLDIVLSSSTHMQKLIDDLLAFSRVGTQKVKFKEILLGPMIKRILLDLDSNIKDSKAEIIINDLPKTIFADESMMIQTFLNLINNGLKFTKKGTAPIIEISFKDTKTHWNFSIEDNGIGIKKQNISKIFGIFEKLHSNDIYEGTGLGLSICKKVIEIHEGNISVSSEIDKGTCFNFSIKKNLSLKK